MTIWKILPRALLWRSGAEGDDVLEDEDRLDSVVGGDFAAVLKQQQPPLASLPQF